jgi:hypothetical protein
MTKRLWLFCLILLLPVVAFAADTRSVAILFDVSRSIPPADFEKAKRVFAVFVDQTGAGGENLIYEFGNSLSKIDPSQISSIRATDTTTSLYDSLYDVAQELASRSASKKAIIIVSDGNDTTSATVLEDTVSYANANGIAIYGIGLGHYNSRAMERIAKLTGGKFFPLSNTRILNDLEDGINKQKPAASAKLGTPATSVQRPEQAPVKASPAQPAAPAPAKAERPAERSSLPYLWIAGIFGVILLIIGLIFVLTHSFRQEARLCPTCGKKLEPYQTICQECSTTPAISRPLKQTVQDTQEMRPREAEETLASIPKELLQKKPLTEEDLSKTFVLMETPVLVVRKGPNLGQAFSLNRAFPVSIGRSRVNEILVDDTAVSAQHARIIPENGKHVLYDLGSTNGTFLNERKVAKAILKEGDTIKVGETQFQFKIEQHRN